MKRLRQVSTLAFVLITGGSLGIVGPVPIPTHLRAEGCLTTDCHVDMAQKIAAAKIQHEPIRRGTCKSCHQAHGDWLPQPGLTQPVPNLCYSCHGTFGKFIESSRYLHTPVREGRCTLCHGPHGADYVKLLLNYRPPSGDQWESYGGSPTTLFCIDCHGRDLIFKTESDEVTQFRNGTHNLHAFHVFKKQGRSCVACHEIHAANQPFHIRPDVPFGTGGWRLPISFTKTDTGGSCVVGCHKTKGYDRIHPTQ